jgi:hypothetical protein
LQQQHASVEIIYIYTIRIRLRNYVLSIVYQLWHKQKYGYTERMVDFWVPIIQMQKRVTPRAVAVQWLDGKCGNSKYKNLRRLSDAFTYCNQVTTQTPAKRHMRAA